ncbi:MAG: DUF4249 family protein [Paludibacter sp.]
MKTSRQNTIIIFLALLLLTGCEKEINIDLNKSNPKFVIEGNVSNIAGNSKVRISKTLDFDENVLYPFVSGAFVTITDSTLNRIDTLTEKTIPGTYTNPDLIGITGHTYNLIVKIDDQTYSSTSTMPIGLTLDSIIQENLAGTGGDLGIPEGTSQPGDIIQIRPYYINPHTADEYYQYVVKRNDRLLNNIIPRKEMASSGTSFIFPLFIKAKKNDVIQVDMQFVEKKVYDYLYGISQNYGQYSATPSNPEPNISNGALGYFKAHTSQNKTIIIR